MNAVEIVDAVADLAAQPFEAAEFPFQFLAAFDKKETQLKRLRKGDTNRSDVPGGVLLQSNIHLAVCPLGETHATLGILKASPQTAKAKAKFILATDGQTLEAEELSTGEAIASEFPKLADHIGFFLPLAGISTVREIKDNPIDVRATGRLNKLYVELLRQNPNWGTDARRHDMNHFMARLIFCFFAEDTDIFHARGRFTQTIEQFSESDGSNTHQVIEACFRAMNTKIAERQAAGVSAYADAFPYVNGGLFAGATEVPLFTRIARSYLLQAGSLDWQHINPDIFGSMIQAVADKGEREQLGMHYTSVPNILKVLNPLFLDELRAQLEAAGSNPRVLLNLRKRLSRIRVFDPACGSGNFLVIAYKELRKIEAEVNNRRNEPMLPTEISKKNFRGIEIRDFAAEIARLALVIAEYQCDVLHRGPLAAKAEFLPLDEMNWISCGNALRLDWLHVCPTEGTGVKLVADDLFQTPLNQSAIDFENEGGETFICGNPPYVGSSKQNEEQKRELRDVFVGTTDAYKNLDFIGCWFLLAARYCSSVQGAAAFVTTNSICQGEQVSLLWPFIFSFGVEIAFAYGQFTWSNLAQKNAGVTCVVVGISRISRASKFLIDDEKRRETAHINGYLLSYPDLFIPRHAESICGLPKMLKGNQATDGGYLTLSANERRSLIHEDPGATKFVRQLIGSRELIEGLQRYCLWIEDKDLLEAISYKLIGARLDEVKAIRLQSPAASTRKRAGDSHRFIQVQDYDRPAIVIPEVSSERREYLPCALMNASSIATNKLFALYDSDLYVLSLCCSRLHRTWIATVCGRMRTDFSYSNVLGWNTFPVPPLTEQDKADLTGCAGDVLLARETHFPATIADLYNPEAMPKNLRAAHDRNDETLERIYIGRRFKNDTERLETLFSMYAKMTAEAPAANTTAKNTRVKKAQA